jgi:predicted acetyltransferase
MSLEIRPITDEEVPAYREAMMQTFGDDAADVDPDGAARVRRLIPIGQLWAAFDEGSIIATSGTFDHAISLPGGGQIPMAGLTMVSVRPTHRRRGILRELMRLHLEDARRRGYAISGLWASEASIYGRFGYGVAAEGDEVEIANAHTLELEAHELDAVCSIDEARARRELPAIYARAMADRPGALIRSEAWWTERRFLEAPIMRHGASRRRHVLAVRGGAAVGYVQYRQRPEFQNGLPVGSVEIIELVAADARAEATLWQLVLRVDLFPKVTWWNAPVDDALTWLVGNPRRVTRRRSDTLWLRIEDVAAALAARRYMHDGRVQLVIDDGAWELVAEGGQGRCTPLPGGAGDAALRMSRATLGSLYLGTFPASRLARAGRIAGPPAAIAAADRVFAAAVAPWCPEVF